MKPEYYFLAGLPRSGSTLLRSILNQHPDLYSGPICPSVELLYYTDKYFETSEMLIASPQPKSCYNILSKMVDNFYEPILEKEKKNTVILFNRALPNNIERFKTYVKEDVKIVCPVRDVLEIIASFIALIHKNSDRVNFVDQHLIQNNIEVNDNNRVDYLMSPNGIIDQSLWAMSRAYIRNEQHLLHIVEYNDLVNNPQEEMNKIYEFWGLELYQHTYDNLENKYPENDILQYQLTDMHTVRNTVSKVCKNPEEILSNYVLEKYSGLEFWKNPNSPYLKMP